jgi:hypothetical protein
MKWLQQRRQTKQRKTWLADLEWFRVHYDHAEQTTRALTLLSRQAAAGRIAILFDTSADFTFLIIGIPKPFVPLLEQIAQDFGFMLSFGSAFELPEQSLVPYTDCTWKATFTGQLIHGNLFRHDLQLGMPFPTPKDAGNLPTLPAKPPMGLARQPQWDNYLSAAQFAPPAAAPWLLGYTAGGQLVATTGKVGIYGKPDRMNDWLTQQLQATLKHDTAHLVVIDLDGQVISALKRKPIVTRLLNEQIRYLDLAGETIPTPLNPLAPLINESENDLLLRWRKWFRGMGMRDDSFYYLDLAFQEGVRDLLTLQKWLRGQRRRTQCVGLVQLESVVNRLLNDETVRDWLGVATEPLIPDTTLLFGYKDNSWGGKQIARAVIMAALHDPKTRLVLNLPFLSDRKAFENADNPILTTVPNLPVQTEVSVSWLTTSETVRRDARLMENALLLRSGECIAVRNEHASFLHW